MRSSTDLWRKPILFRRHFLYHLPDARYKFCDNYLDALVLSHTKPVREACSRILAFFCSGTRHCSYLVCLRLGCLVRSFSSCRPIYSGPQVRLALAFSLSPTHMHIHNSKDVEVHLLVLLSVFVETPDVCKIPLLC